MLEQAQQSHNQHKPDPTGIYAAFEDPQHPRLQKLAKKMQERVLNASCEIDHDIIERFFERMLPVTFLNWMCKP